MALDEVKFNALAGGILADQFLISGVLGKSTTGAAQNRVQSKFPFARGFRPPIYEQYKHHRWALDREQIINYGLGGMLNPFDKWWEGMSVEKRQLGFFAAEEWLTLCVLVCEDLARQDPTAELVRAVGPNLVIALLMDGPQLTTRWSNRYATVLADDPGSSVLTLTSLGMSRLSRPFNQQTPQQVVALWKDCVSGTVEISLPTGAEAVILSLANKTISERTADGRCHNDTSALVLAGIHPMTMPKEKKSEVGSASSETKMELNSEKKAAPLIEMQDRDVWVLSHLATLTEPQKRERLLDLLPNVAVKAVGRRLLETHPTNKINPAQKAAADEHDPVLNAILALRGWVERNQPDKPDAKEKNPADLSPDNDPATLI